MAYFHWYGAEYMIQNIAFSLDASICFDVAPLKCDRNLKTAFIKTRKKRRR